MNKDKEKSIKLTWRYVCKNEDDTYKTRIISERVRSGDERTDSIFAYIADLEYVRRIIAYGVQDNSESNISNRILKERIVPFELARRNDYMALQTVAMFATRVKLYAIEALNNELSENSSTEEIEMTAQKRCDYISRALCYFAEKQQKNIWDQLLDAAKQTINGLKSNSPKQEVSRELVSEVTKYVKDNEKGRKRCIGCYIFKDSKLPPLVSFSGYLDCDDEKICKGLGIKHLANKYVKNAFNHICHSVNARLISTNMNIFYYESTGPVLKPVRLEDKINSRVCESILRPLYRCCERKIFTEFNKKSGTMYTTLNACEKCQNAFKYYRDEGMTVCSIDNRRTEFRE